MPKESSIVGDLINFRGLIYSPVNEQGVVYLFSKVAEDLNMYVEEVRTAYPDCVARRFNGKGWEKIYIEFEYLSNNFVQHGHNQEDCDIIVCWENNWKDCPLEILELKTIIKGLPNKIVVRPDKYEQSLLDDNSTQKTELFENLGISQFVINLYEKFESEILSIGSGIWRKVVPPDYFTFYSPKRVFIYATLQKSSIRLTIFTRGNDIPNVKPINYKTGGHKWGKIWIKTESDLELAVEACRVSYERIIAALKDNEPTGWYAEVEPDNLNDDEISCVNELNTSSEDQKI